MLQTCRYPLKDEKGVSTFRISPEKLAKWMHQNKAQYTGDVVVGSLLDSFMLVCKNGYAAVYERYVNPNMSTYEIQFERGNAQTVWDNWRTFESSASAEAEQ